MAASRFHDVWLIPTQHGPAIRSRFDMVAEGDPVSGEFMRRIGAPLSPASIIPVRLLTSDLSTTPFLPTDMPDPLRSETDVCNVCGFVSGFAVAAPHPAWRTVRSTLGCFKEAYTLRGGNLIFLRGKLVFKGAVSFQVVLCISFCERPYAHSY
jgi:hypothetical protein